MGILPGRPDGDAEAVRQGARSWDDLALALRDLERAVGPQADVGSWWQGAATAAYQARWDQFASGFDVLDGQIHAVSGKLRDAADNIEAAQHIYDGVAAALLVTTAVGIAATIFTIGLSDAAAAGADAGEAAAATTALEVLAGVLRAVVAFFDGLLTDAGALLLRFQLALTPMHGLLVTGGAGALATDVTMWAAGDHQPLDLAVGAVLGFGSTADPGFGMNGGGGSSPTGPTGRPLATGAPTSGEGVWVEISDNGQLIGLQGTGAGPDVHEVPGDAAAAQSFYDHLTGNALQSAEPAPGVVVRTLADGTTITFRAVSKSGPPTIDVNLPGRGYYKLKFKP